MDKNSFKECLLAKFKFWILTTKLRDEIGKGRISFRSNMALLSIFDVANIINLQLKWKDTTCGYDTCAEAQVEWSILVVGYYLSLKERGALSGISQERLDNIEHQIYEVFYMSLEKYKLYTSLWSKRHERKTNKILMKLLEDHKESVRDSQITKTLERFEYFDTD